MDTRVLLDCENCALNASTARLVEQVDAERAIAARLAAERDQALAWAALWKRAATIDRAGCHYHRWVTRRHDLEHRTPKYWGALFRALGLCPD